MEEKNKRCNHLLVIEVLFIVLVTVLITLLWTSFYDFKAYATTDNFICAPVNVSELEHDVLVHEQCHVLVNNNWEHFCTDRDSFKVDR